MPLRNVVPAKPSARSVYAKQPLSKKNPVKQPPKPKKKPISPARVPSTSALKKASDKGHGKPNKNLISPARVQSKLASRKIRPLNNGRPKKLSTTPAKRKSSLQRKKKMPRKRTSSVTFKTTTEIIESHSSEADLSSEGEESDSDKKERAEDVQQSTNDIQESGYENEQEVEKEANPSDVDVEDVSGTDVSVHEDEELDSTDAIEGEQNDSEDARYSFPEPSDQPVIRVQQPGPSSYTSAFKVMKNKDRISQVQIKREVKDKNVIKTENSNKRRITQEDSQEFIQRERTHKKKKKSNRANLPIESAANGYNSPGSSRVPSVSPQHNFNPNRASTSFRSSPAPPPRIDSTDSLSRLNKAVPCGNIAADQAFRWLIGPTLPVDFFHNIFEKTPFTVQRENPYYYKDLFSGNDLNTMLKEHSLEYNVHIDIVKYVNGMRLAVSGDGRAYYSSVWEDYKQGYSLRVRNPQAYNKNIWRLCSLLQEYFSSTVGCNIYLTPPKAQGFPPHYDDIDAFIVQVEGKKYWKVYSPRRAEEDLARYSSVDFTPSEIGSPVLQVCLNAGEMLYIPRGYIHQAATDDADHSLHLTFSTNQLNTWGDLLLIAAKNAVETAILRDPIFRQSIPKDYMDYLGTSVSKSKAFKRFELMNKLKDLAKKAMTFIDADEAADVHSLKFIRGCLPPTFNKIERDHSLHGNGSYWRNGEIKVKGLIEDETEIQLMRKRILRLVIDDNIARLYHTVENARDPKPVNDDGPLASFVDFDMEAIPCYLYLYKNYPEFVKVKDIPLREMDDRLSFATSLYDNGLIMTKEPLPPDTDDFDWSTIPDMLPSFGNESS